MLIDMMVSFYEADFTKEVWKNPSCHYENAHFHHTQLQLNSFSFSVEILTKVISI